MTIRAFKITEDIKRVSIDAGVCTFEKDLSDDIGNYFVSESIDPTLNYANSWEVMDIDELIKRYDISGVEMALSDTPLQFSILILEPKKGREKREAVMKYSNGSPVQQCAVHKLQGVDDVDPVTTILGMAVCTKHFNEATDACVGGKSISEYLRIARLAR